MSPLIFNTKLNNIKNWDLEGSWWWRADLRLFLSREFCCCNLLFLISCPAANNTYKQHLINAVSHTNNTHARTLFCLADCKWITRGKRKQLRAFIYVHTQSPKNENSFFTWVIHLHFSYKFKIMKTNSKIEELDTNKFGSFPSFQLV